MKKGTYNNSAQAKTLIMTLRRTNCSGVCKFLRPSLIVLLILGFMAHAYWVAAEPTGMPHYKFEPGMTLLYETTYDGFSEGHILVGITSFQGWVLDVSKTGEALILVEEKQSPLSSNQQDDKKAAFDYAREAEPSISVFKILVTPSGDYSIQDYQRNSFGISFVIRLPQTAKELSAGWTSSIELPHRGTVIFKNTVPGGFSPEKPLVIKSELENTLFKVLHSQDSSKRIQLRTFDPALGLITKIQSPDNDKKTVQKA